MAALTVEVCIVPAQFNPGAYALVQALLLGGTACLMTLELFPGKRVHIASNLVMAAGSIFILSQMACIYWPVSRSEGVVLSAPFRGEWLVLNGGQSSLINGHYPYDNQREALDIERLVNGREQTKLGTSLESYPSWGETIYAPADGTVTEIENNLPDNPMGQTDTEHPAGNHIVIDIGSGHYVMLAHFQKGSITVATGDKVRDGQAIGKCGHSGNTSHPHLHIQVQDQPEFSDSAVKTYPIFFKDVTCIHGSHQRTEAPFFVKRNDRIICQQSVSAAPMPVAASNESSSNGLTETWSPTLDPGEKPDLQKIRDSIKKLMDMGEYDEALGRQIWYFNHALEFGELNPIRTSFGIMNWGELARRYPKAKQALTEFRDRDAKKIAAGDGYSDLFIELTGLNRQLRDDDSTYETFKVMMEKDPELAQSCYSLIEDILVKKGDYQLCLKYLGDPQSRFEQIKREYQIQMANNEQWADSVPKPVLPTNLARIRLPFSPPDRLASMEQSTKSRFVAQNRQLIEILAATGNEDEAEKIQDDALAVLDDPKLHSAVSDAVKKTAWANWNNQQKIGSFYSVAGTTTETVAVGIDGRIATRDNQTGTWTVQTFPGDADFRAVIHAKEQYVVVREHGGIMTSRDGLAWTRQNSPTTANLLGLFWDGHQYFAGGDHGTILTSPDGIIWTQQNCASDVNIYAFACSGTTYIAVGNDGICRSADGVTWVAPTTQHLTEHIPFTACIWNGNEFLACGLGLDRYPTIYTSTDGDIWTLRETSITTSLRAAITVNGSVYIAGNNVIKKSSDGGTTWKDAYLNPDFNNLFMGLTYNGREIIAAGFNHNVIASKPSAEKVGPSNNLPKVNPATGTTEITPDASGTIETITAPNMTYNPQTQVLTASGNPIVVTTINTNIPASQKPSKP